MVNSVATSTANSYQTGVNHYLRFCSSVVPRDFPIWSPPYGFILYFLTYLASSTHLSLAFRTITRYLTAVEQRCFFLGGSTQGFFHPLVISALKGVKNSVIPKKARTRLPITVPILRQLLSASSTHRGIDPVLNASFRAGACLGVFALLRGGEFSVKPSEPERYPRRKDFVTTQYGATLFLARSKTDYRREGVTVHVFAQPASPSTCPVRAVLHALHVAPDKSPDAPLLQNRAGQPMKDSYVLARVRSLLALCGYDPKSFGKHSFRIGGATELAHRKVPVHLIMALGRWKSDAYVLYLMHSIRDLQEAALVMASPDQAVSKSGTLHGLPLSQAVNLRAEDIPSLAEFFQAA